jgi:hypothetical protein
MGSSEAFNIEKDVEGCPRTLGGLGRHRVVLLFSPEVAGEVKKRVQQKSQQIQVTRMVKKLERGSEPVKTGALCGRDRLNLGRSKDTETTDGVDGRSFASRLRPFGADGRTLSWRGKDMSVSADRVQAVRR